MSDKVTEQPDAVKTTIRTWLHEEISSGTRYLRVSFAVVEADNEDKIVHAYGPDEFASIIRDIGVSSFLTDIGEPRFIGFDKVVCMAYQPDFNYLSYLLPVMKKLDKAIWNDRNERGDYSLAATVTALMKHLKSDKLKIRTTGGGGGERRPKLDRFMQSVERTSDQRNMVSNYNRKGAYEAISALVEKRVKEAPCRQSASAN